MLSLCLETPVGPITLHQKQETITGLTWGGHGDVGSVLLSRAAAQIAEYFAGTRTSFDLDLRVDGSELQRAVCGAMQNIPFGETRTYGDIGRDLGLPAQVVGQACGANPIPLIIPCHRVLGAGNLGGFSGGTGIETKVWLLRHEGAAGLLI